MIATAKIEINPSDLYRKNSKQELLDLIIKLDEKVRDMNFTLEIFERLINSLKEDMTKEELTECLKDFIDKSYEND